MKKLLAMLLVMLMLVSVCALASCGDPCADGHVDADGNEVCDNCEASVPKEPEPEKPAEPLPEEPERDPTYKITFYFHGIVYENEKAEDGTPVYEDNGRPHRIAVEQDVELHVLDVLQNQAPTEEQLAEIPGITYGGISAIAWYDSPELKNEVTFKDVVLTEDKAVYAKLRIDEPNKKGDQYCGDEAYWEVTSKGKLKITGKGAMYDFTYPELVPWYFNEDGTRRQITGVEIGKDITHIGSYSFYNLGIAQGNAVELGEGVTSIGDYAFAYSTLLKDLPLYYYDKDGNAFSNITTIGWAAFQGCKSVPSIVIPDSVVKIDGYAFAQCSGFKNIVLGTGIKDIGQFAFNQSTSTPPDNKVSATHEYIYYRGTAKQYAEVVVQLGNPNFNSYGSYLYFYVEADSEEAKTAGQYWTYDNEGYPKPLSYTIRYTTEGDAFPLLTDFVFIGADKTGVFTQANVDAMNSITYRGYKFAHWNNAAYVAGTAKVTKHTTFIGVRGDVVGDNATYEYTAGTKTLTIKGTGATWDFAGAGDTVYYKNYISTVKFDEGITKLGANLLAGITTLVSVEIPESVTEVDPKLFSGCTSLTAVYYLGSDLSKCKGLDSLIETNAKVYAKGSDSSAGKEGAYWQDKADGTRLAWSFKDGVLTIGGDNVMPDFAVGEAPWLKYTNAKELAFSANITTIGANAFAGLKGVEKITLHSKLVNIPRSAFEGSDYWNNAASWDNGALMAGEHLLAFDASKMTTTYAVIPQATKIIAAGAFDGCGSITELVLPNVINHVDETSFDGLTGVTRIYFYGQNVNAWNALPTILRNDLASAKILYRANAKPAENPGDFWRNVKKVPTTWDKE